MAIQVSDIARLRVKKSLHSRVVTQFLAISVPAYYLVLLIFTVSNEITKLRGERDRNLWHT